MAGENVTFVTLYLLAGMKAEVSIPRVDANPRNAFSAQGEHTAENGEKVVLQNGFLCRERRCRGNN